MFDGVGYNVLFQILLGGAVLGGAYRIGRIRIIPDLTYGVFLYHMIIINVVIQYNFVHFESIVSQLFYGVCIVCISIMLAYFSLQYIEKPMGAWMIKKFAFTRDVKGVHQEVQNP